MCPRCPAAKDLGVRLSERGVLVTAHDVDTAEGLAEAAFYRVLTTPAVLIIEGETVLAMWRGDLPAEDEVLHELA